MQEIEHLDQLLSFNGREFVEAAYRTILRRSADDDGLRHYIDRLARGDGKEAVILALTTSSEALGMHHRLPGLSRAIKRRRKSRFRQALKWLLGLDRIERALNRTEHAQYVESRMISASIEELKNCILDIQSGNFDGSPRSKASKNSDSGFVRDVTKALAELGNDADKLMREMRAQIRSSTIIRFF